MCHGLQKTLNETGKEWKRLLGRSRATYSDSSSSDDDDDEDEEDDEDETKAEEAKEGLPNGAPKTEATQPVKQELKASGAAPVKDEAKQGDSNTGKRKREADDPSEDKTAKAKRETVDNSKGNGAKSDASATAASATPTGTYTYPISPAERPKQCEQEVRNILSAVGPMTTKVVTFHLRMYLCTLHSSSLYL